MILILNLLNVRLKYGIFKNVTIAASLEYLSNF